jgi:hypothetical protein
MCAPGFYAALRQLSQCTTCPAGFKCPNFGMWIPIVCPRGSYRSNADAITCRACPMGTWSPGRGVTDKNMCQPCPPGRVCGQNAMVRLDASTSCLAGYYCPPGTAPARQFALRCPAGYTCDVGIGAERIFDHICPAGYVCTTGTPLQLAKRAGCPTAYYCPSGTYGAFTIVNSIEMPVFINQALVQSVMGTPTLIADPMPMMVVICPGPPGSPVSNSPEILLDTSSGTGRPILRTDPITGERVTTQLCNVWNQTWPMPNGQFEMHVPNFCMRGTSSDSKATSINDCFPIKGRVSNKYDSLTFYSPVLPASAGDDIPYAENTNSWTDATGKQIPFANSGLYTMSPFFLYSFTCDWSGLDHKWVYATPPDSGAGIDSLAILSGNFNLTLTSEQSANLTQFPNLPAPSDKDRLPTNFESTLVDKYNVWTLQITPLVFMQLNLMINIMHGTFLMRAWDFHQTCNISSIRPLRANWGTNDMFLSIAVWDDTALTDIPLNLPKIQKEQTAYLVGFGPSNTSVPLVNEKTASVYVSPTDRLWTTSDTSTSATYPLPYLPFFSNCRGYGSYVPIFDLFENPQYCSLVPLEKTKIVSQTDFFKVAVSDECSSQLSCSFEEDVSKPSTNGVRWFDIKGNQVLFYLSSYPVPYDQINLTTTPKLFPGNIESIAGLFDTSFRGVDVVPVRASRDTLGKPGLPRTVAFTVYYHQVQRCRPFACLA